MVQHMGSLHGGHYISHARNRQDGRWYTFNDADVSQTDAGSVAAREGYLLFYVRRRGPAFAPAVLPPRASKEEDADHYVSMAWWLRYCMLSVPGPLSNADILCDHGSLKMQLGGETENLTIALTRRQYEVLAAAYGASDPPLRDLSPCKECIVSDWCRSRVIGGCGAGLEAAADRVCCSRACGACLGTHMLPPAHAALALLAPTPLSTVLPCVSLLSPPSRLLAPSPCSTKPACCRSAATARRLAS
jgi:hypothetical protein